jgi:hypothetical protein
MDLFFLFSTALLIDFMFQSAFPTPEPQIILPHNKEGVRKVLSG